MSYLELAISYISTTGIKVISVISAVMMSAMTDPLPFWSGAAVGFISYVLIREGLVKLKKSYEV